MRRLDPDASLLRGLKDGTRAERESALRALMDRHGTRLHGSATRMLGDATAAEDVVQETFLKAWARAADWTPGEAVFATWLRRVCTNACLDRLRKVRPVTGQAFEHIPDAARPADMRLVHGERDARVRTAIAALPPRQKAALVLSVYDGVSQTQGAAALGVSEGAYESLLVRARRGVRAQLANVLERQDAV